MTYLIIIAVLLIVLMSTYLDGKHIMLIDWEQTYEKN